MKEENKVNILMYIVKERERTVTPEVEKNDKSFFAFLLVQKKLNIILLNLQKILKIIFLFLNCVCSSKK